ncbi:MAG TPA: hypothetical protein VMW86_04740 [Dehalococcoidales bacterium]|nr:hypothetical protein [Dehalococcoidales bacterium]
MGGFQTPGGGGITRLSELIINADKDWQAMGISNLKEIALGMTRGDIPVRNHVVLSRLVPGNIGYVLTSAGPLHIPTWAPPGGALNYYFPAEIFGMHDEGIAPVDQSHNKNAPIANPDYKMAYGDAPADMIKQLTPTIVIPSAEAIVAVDQSHNKNSPIACDIAILVDGAVSETNAAVQTDETALARSAALNDMVLCPMTPIAGDKYYLGFAKQYRRVYIKVSTAGSGNWTNQTFYWNGAWIAAPAEDDQTGSFITPGTNRIDMTMPGDWALSVIMAMNLYWIKIQTIAFVNQVTAPLGAQAWACPVA